MTHPGTWRETGCTSGLAGTLHLSGVRGHLADGVGVPFTEDTFWMPKRETGLGVWGLPGTGHPRQGQRGGSPEGERREKRESGPPAAQLPSGSRENQPQEALGRHSGWPGPLGRTAPRHLPQTAHSAPGRPSCCPGLGSQRRPTSDAAPGSSPGCCRVPAHLGPAGRGAGRGPAAAGGGPSWWRRAGGRRPGEGGSGEAGSRGSRGGRVTAFIGLEDCTTAHTDVKGGVQRPGRDSNK